MSAQHDQLLLDTLRSLRSAVDKVQDSQDKMRTELHNAVMENTRITSAIEGQIQEALAPIAARVSALEGGQAGLRDEVKRDARKWGAAGGAGAVITAGLTAVVAVIAKAITK